MFRIIGRKISGVFFFFLNLLKRALCCLRLRRRKLSKSLLPISNADLEHISVPMGFSGPPGEDTLEEQVSWENWGITSVSHSQEMQTQDAHTNNLISGGKYSSTKMQPAPELEEEPNFFENMTPSVRRPKKVLIHKKEELAPRDDAPNRLQMDAISGLPAQGPELGAWVESNNLWEDDTDEVSWDADAVIREKRKQERERRLAEHVRKKQDHHAKKQATSLSKMVR
ncbi:PREDICTED: receptor-binding cancer antigen expressed on SiSo cells-like [Priapulus caudatus]|uniref:Receptor-binding cancer antigen expressed on SiSo cells-like n=1 Tax=Priapulus caudatus TaxID=37621 RepID=A0ABM1F0F7_PRICU|nr:PREDICTED: receptor-binding cancer antigen expressed on SiSo cells-like [Priapulus caudatus]